MRRGLLAADIGGGGMRGIDDLDIGRAMARLRKALLARISRDDRAEVSAARRRLPRAELAGYDLAALGRLLRPRLDRDGRGWRVVAASIGVTAPDLSRVMAGQQIAAGKVFAICDWLRVDPRRFYVPAKGVVRRRPQRRAKTCFTGKALKRKVSRCREG